MMVDVGIKVLFACDECPIVDEFEQRMEIAIRYPEYGGFQFDHCGCDKVGDEFFMCGYCEDAWASKRAEQESGRRNTGRAYRRKMRRKQLQKFRDRSKFSRICVAPYLNSGRWSEEEFDWIGAGSHICHPQNSKNKKFFKRVSNKKVRKAKLNPEISIPLKGNGYRRLFDYWWTLY